MTSTDISTKRLVLGFFLVFVLGILFSVVNGSYVSETNQQLPFFVYIISFVSILLGATLVLLFQWKMNRLQLERLLRVLPHDERTIVKILIDVKMIEQNKLVVLAGFSRLQVSRAVQKLAQSEVVEKRDMGNTNLVILKI